jgi:glucosamine--fructose-6-phosphate aminotransferase (isomerizing)
VALGAIAVGVASLTRAASDADLRKAVQSFGRLNAAAQRALSLDEAMREIGRRMDAERPVMFLGRGALHPIALEGALKLKEISYIPAEGFAAGELKHGPLALIAPETEVFALAPFDDLFSKTLSNVAEVEARGGRVRLLTDGAGHDMHGPRGIAEALPLADTWMAPILYVIPLQLLAYHAAHALGRNIDRPRNLAKSVTVE